MATVTPPQAEITTEEFAQRPDPGHPEELVKGRIVALTFPGARHGQICARIVHNFGIYTEDHDIGHVLCNGTGVITERNPDSVRGADIAFYSYAKISKGPLPNAYPAVMPDLVVEVRSPDDRWTNILKKVVEYLDAGVGVVCVLDDDSRTAHVYDGEHAARILDEDEELTFPDLLPDFRVPLRRFFE